MNPMHWIRWKILAGLVMVIGGFVFFGINPLAKAAINRIGSAGRTIWSVTGFNFAAASGRVEVSGLEMDRAATARLPETSDPIAAAQLVVCDLDMQALLRRRFHGEVHVSAPRLRLERRDDGSMSVGVDAGVPSGPSSRLPTDWWAEAQKWIEQMQRWDEQRRKIAEKIPSEKVEDKVKEIAGPKKSPFRVDYSRRVQYPFQHAPRIVATRLVADGLVLTFVDNSPSGQARGPIPPLTDARVLIENLSDDPAAHSQPIRWTITGQLAGAPMKLAGVLDQRAMPGTLAKTIMQFEFLADALPLDTVHYFAGDSIPIQFDRGTIKMRAHGTVTDWNRLDVRPAFEFRDANVSPRPGVESVAGVSPAAFCRAFSEVGTVEINDMRITGTVSRPTVELGQTITDLVRSSGRAIVKQQLDRGVQKASELVNDAIDRELEKAGAQRLSPDIRQSVEEVRRGIGDRLKGLPFGDRSKKGTVQK